MVRKCAIYISPKFENVTAKYTSFRPKAPKQQIQKLRVLSSRLLLFSCFLHPRSGGGGILPSNRLMGMCRWIDYNGVTFSPGAPLTYFNDGGGSDRGSYFIPKKIPQRFCISKFYYLSSGKLKHANFNFGFGKKKTINWAYFIFDLS